MADASGDVLMRMFGPDGAIAAESQTVIKPGTDQMWYGFRTGYFCELQSFRFAAGVTPVKDIPKEPPTDPEDRKKWEKDMQKIISKQTSAGPASAKPQAVDMQPIEFTRMMDAASPVLFKSLVACDTLTTISVIKRKASGTAASGEIYLRIDFSKVLLTELEWSDKEHFIEETGTFIYRNLMVRYRPQAADGKLGAVIPMEWKMKT